MSNEEREKERERTSSVVCIFHSVFPYSHRHSSGARTIELKALNILYYYSQLWFHVARAVASIGQWSDTHTHTMNRVNQKFTQQFQKHSLSQSQVSLWFNTLTVAVVVVVVAERTNVNSASILHAKDLDLGSFIFILHWKLGKWKRLDFVLPPLHLPKLLRLPTPTRLRLWPLLRFQVFLSICLPPTLSLSPFERTIWMCNFPLTKNYAHNKLPFLFRGISFHPPPPSIAWHVPTGDHDDDGGRVDGWVIWCRAMSIRHKSIRTTWETM